MVPTTNVYAGKEVIARGEIENGPSTMALMLALFEPKVCGNTRTVTFEVLLPIHGDFPTRKARVQCVVEMAYRLDMNCGRPLWVFRGECVGVSTKDWARQKALPVTLQLVGRKIVVETYSCQLRANGNLKFLAD